MAVFLEEGQEQVGGLLQTDELPVKQATSRSGRRRVAIAGVSCLGLAGVGAAWHRAGTRPRQSHAANDVELKMETTGATWLAASATQPNVILPGLAAPLNGPGTGVQVCENKGYSYTECVSIGCCYFAEGDCKSEPNFVSTSCVTPDGSPVIPSPETTPLITAGPTQLPVAEPNALDGSGGLSVSNAPTAIPPNGPTHAQIQEPGDLGLTPSPGGVPSLVPTELPVKTDIPAFLVGELPVALRKWRYLFARMAVVFSIPIFSDAETPEWIVEHTANVFAQWIDNNQDGEPDDPKVLKALKEGNSTIMIFSSSVGESYKEYQTHQRDFPGQAMFADEVPDRLRFYYHSARRLNEVDQSQWCGDWAAEGECQTNPMYMHEFCPASCKKEEPAVHAPAPPAPAPHFPAPAHQQVDPSDGGHNDGGLEEEDSTDPAAEPIFDGTLEATLTMIISGGYAQAYPEYWKYEGESAMIRAMDKMIGDCGYAFDGTQKYPSCSGKFHLSSENCNRMCLGVKYTMWSLMSVLGAFDGSTNIASAGVNLCDDFKADYELCTKELVKTEDPDIFALFDLDGANRFRFPTKLPEIDAYFPSPLPESKYLELTKDFMEAHVLDEQAK